MDTAAYIEERSRRSESWLEDFVPPADEPPRALHAASPGHLPVGGWTRLRHDRIARQLQLLVLEISEVEWIPITPEWPQEGGEPCQPDLLVRIPPDILPVRHLKITELLIPQGRFPPVLGASWTKG